MRSKKAVVIMAFILALSISSAHGPGNYIFAETYKPGQTEEEGLFSGVVKENNPSLGYITLYFEDGSGVDINKSDRIFTLRKFTYGYGIPVLRDGYEVGVDDIKPGDMAFIKLDKEGYIEKISVKSYYETVYGTAYLIRATWLVLKKDDGTFVNYPLSGSLPVYKHNRPCSASDIIVGDRIRVLVQTNGDSIDIAGIDIEKQTRPVNGIYRGNVEFFDIMNSSIAVSGVQEFINGRWEATSGIGIQSFGYSIDYKEKPPARSAGMVYFVTKKAYDGTDKVVSAAFRGTSGFERTTMDNLLGMTDAGILELENTSDFITYDKYTIAVKDGRLIDVSALGTLDPVKISMEKSLYGNKYTANVIVCDPVSQSGLILYRGRIKDVDPHKSVTVESFVQLNGVNWEFTNTPKTFDIDLSVTRLVEADGVGNVRNLDSSYINQSVYIVADGTKICLISTAPYADQPVMGRVAGLVQDSGGNEGEATDTPAILNLKEARVYDNEDYVWEASPDLSLTIPVNAVVIKNGQIGTTSLIKPGDEVRIIRHSQSGEGIIILCQ
ncbi:MAG: hypothetical protein ACOYIF_03720 [Acetivibrionales bacterium]|jgi:hypothetical protein